jgi:hypothetical protein
MQIRTVIVGSVFFCFFFGATPTKLVFTFALTKKKKKKKNANHRRALTTCDRRQALELHGCLQPPRCALEPVAAGAGRAGLKRKRGGPPNTTSNNNNNNNNDDDLHSDPAATLARWLQTGRGALRFLDVTACGLTMSQRGTIVRAWGDAREGWAMLGDAGGWLGIDAFVNAGVLTVHSATPGAPWPPLDHRSQHQQQHQQLLQEEQLPES